MNDEVANRLANVLAHALNSPNEPDSNGEIANVVDGLFAIARAIHHLAKAVEEHASEEDHYS